MGQGKRLWTLGMDGPEPVCRRKTERRSSAEGGEHAERPKTRPPRQRQLLRGSSSSSESLIALAEEPRSLVVIGLGAARRLRDDRVDTPSSRQWSGVELERGRRLPLLEASRQRIAAQPSGEITE